jgi:hypothetical protein
VKAAKKWSYHVEQVHRAASDIPTGQYLEVRYEQLYASTTDTLLQIGEFLSVEWEEDELRNAITANSADQMRMGGGTPIPIGGEFKTDSGNVVEPAGFVRNAKPSTWKDDLSYFDRLQVWLVAHKRMSQVGYRWTVPW